jgi:hypothetical protein
MLLKLNAFLFETAMRYLSVERGVWGADKFTRVTAPYIRTVAEFGMHVIDVTRIRCFHARPDLASWLL